MAATIGIGLVGIAINMDLNPAVTAGAVISGAYFGDKSSPLSDTANLAAAVGGAELYQHLREVLWTSIPAFAITLLVFFFMGSPGDFDATASAGRSTSRSGTSCRWSWSLRWRRGGFRRSRRSWPVRWPAPCSRSSPRPNA